MKGRVTVIIPALNEAATIASVVSGVQEACGGFDDLTVIVVDDGSTDQTARLALKAGAKVVSHRRWLGLGRAIRTGFKEALASCPDFVVHIDGDGQFDPTDIPRLIEPLAAGRADCVTASRFIEPNKIVRMPWAKRIGNRFVSWVVSSLCGRKFYDVSCGFRAYTADAVLRLTTHGHFTYTHEAILGLSHDGMEVLEVPCKVRVERAHGRSRISGSLIRYGIQAMMIIVRSVRDHHPLRFFGAISLVFALCAVGAFGYLIYHYLTFGRFGQNFWAAFTVLGSLVISAIALTVGLLADMLDRHRMMLRETVYHLRRADMARAKEKIEKEQETQEEAHI